MLEPAIKAARLLQLSIPSTVINEHWSQQAQKLQKAFVQSPILELQASYSTVLESILPSIQLAQIIKETLHPSIEAISNFDFINMPEILKDHEGVGSIISQPLECSQGQKIESLRIDNLPVETYTLENQAANETLDSKESYWTFERILLYIGLMLQLLQFAQAQLPNPQIEHLIRQNQQIIEQLESLNDQ